MNNFFRRWSFLILVLLAAFSQSRASSLGGGSSRGGAGVIEFTNASYNVSESAGSATILLTRTGGSDGSLSVNYATSNGSATVGLDYSGANGTVTFDAGETSKSFSIAILDDPLNEDNETIFVALTGTAVGTPNRIELTIIDDDPLPTLSIGDASISEGHSGTTDLVFTVTLSAPSGRTLQVDYSTLDAAAVQGNDYNGNSGTLVFGVGTTTQTISVQVKGDLTNEADETFFVDLSNSTNAAIADIRGVGTILNDDPAPTVSINNKTVSEGDIGTTNVTFAVTLSAFSGQAIVVNYVTAGNTATAGTDFVATSGSLSIPIGSKSGSITIAVNGDLMQEMTEIFYVNITSPTATVTQGQGIGTINDNDPVPTISITGGSLTEGNSGTTVAPFVVTLSNPSYQQITVDFATSNGTATAGTDYVAQSGQLVFAPGDLSKTINVVVNGDSNFEPNESIVVNLTSVSNASLAVTQAEDEIINDDLELSAISINSVSVTETNKGFVNANLTVTLAPASAQTVSVKYATVDGTAKAGCDYVATSGTLTFTPGTTSLAITVKVNGERKKETNESFSVNLSSPVNGLLGTVTGGVTIVNDDGLPKLWIAGQHAEEGDNGSKPMVFTVRLDKKATSSVTVDYATADGSALAGSDYEVTSGTLTFASGETEKKISVAVLGDLVYEPEESFTIRLSNQTNAKIQDGSGTGSIHNDDCRPVLTICNAAVDEGNSGIVPAIFTVNLSNPSSQIVTVNYATDNGSASSPNDYVSTSGKLTFNPGETVQSFSVSINGDVVTERNEEFYVRLSKADNASIRDAKATGAILNDDVPSIASRFEDLIAYIRGLPAEAFRKPSEKSRASLIDGLNDANRAFQRGNNKTAQNYLKDVLKRINETGNGGWIVQDAVRQVLYPQVLDLSVVLDQAVSSTSNNESEVELAEEVISPMDFGLAQNYPNPFNPTTTIQYTLREPALVSLKVYDMVGREVATLVQAQQGAGQHTVQFNGERLTSGTYIYRIRAGSFTDTRKLVLMK